MSAFRGWTDGAINVCGIFAPQEHAQRGIELLFSYLESAGLAELAGRIRSADLDPGSFCTTAATLGDWRIPSSGEIRLGDACATIPPFTGNGLAMALQGAGSRLRRSSPTPPAMPAGRKPRKGSPPRRGRAFRRRLALAALIHPFFLERRRQSLARRGRRIPAHPLQRALRGAPLGFRRSMFLHALATAVPAAAYTQPECWSIVEKSGVRSRLKKRSMLILHTILRGDHGIARGTSRCRRSSACSTAPPDELNGAFRAEAPRLAGAALNKALAKAGGRARGARRPPHLHLHGLPLPRPHELCGRAARPPGKRGPPRPRGSRLRGRHPDDAGRQPPPGRPAGGHGGLRSGRGVLHGVLPG
jgi:hypothetical protein